MGTVNVGGVRFRVHPQDHQPVHAHGRYAGTVAIVELKADRTVALADRKDKIIPRDAKANDVKRILSAAADSFDEIVAEWEKMQGEN